MIDKSPSLHKTDLRFIQYSILKMKSALIASSLVLLPLAQGFSQTSAFVARPTYNAVATTPRSSSKTTLSMIDQNWLMGGGIAVVSFGLGIGLVAFTETQGERAKERGGGLSDDMSTKLSGMLLEDVEVSSVSDLNSLTSQLEAALKESKGENIEKEIEMTEQDKKRIAEEADDGW